MAGAEARVVWQRTANRCFAQEDAKRAPKLACCQPSAASTKQVDSGLTGSVDVQDQSVAGSMPLNKNPSYSNLHSDKRWWLQLQPSYGYDKGLTYAQLDSMELEMEIKGALINSLPKDTYASHLDDVADDTHVKSNKKCELPFEMYPKESTVSAKGDPKAEDKEVDPLKCKSMEEYLDLVDTRENFDLMELDPSECIRSKKLNDLCFDPVSPWVEAEKTGTWWRTADRDELASLVAQKSLDYIQNCDLPPPQKTNVRNHSYGNSQRSKRNDLSLAQKSQDGHICTPVIHSQASLDSRRTLGRLRALVDDGQTQHGLEKPSSYSTNQNDVTETEAFESDFSKAKLLEALRRSQTRAREAENAINQAYTEKEHVIKLFFKQASELFAYKQWTRLLQLEEALYIQIKNNDQPISSTPTPSPSVHQPRMLTMAACKGMKLRKSARKTIKESKSGGEGGPPRICVVGKHVVSIALGLSLVGAGLLLGWTVGWMLPF